MPKFKQAPRPDFNAIAEKVDRDNFIRAAGSDFKSIAAVKKFLERHGLEERDSVMGWTPLLAAVRYGQLEMVCFLIEQGADVNARGNSDWTALHFAAMLGHSEIMQELLAHQADVNAQTKEGHTPLMFAARMGLISEMKLLLKSHADIDLTNYKLYTARDMALSFKKTEAVRLIDAYVEAEKERRRDELQQKMLKATDFSKGLSKPVPLPRPISVRKP